MKIINNFVSIITLGNFNPAILTPDFLKNVCKIDLGIPEPVRVTPIESQLSYGKIYFSTALDRFQVLEKKPDFFVNSKVILYTDTYLKILAHTPLNASGINFNINIEDADSKALEKYFIEGKEKLLKLLNAQELIIGNLVKYISNEKQDIFNYNVGFIINPQSIVGNITIKKNSPTSYTLNYNYEVRNLNQNKVNMDLLVKKYSERVKEFETLIKTVFQ